MINIQVSYLVNDLELARNKLKTNLRKSKSGCLRESKRLFCVIDFVSMQNIFADSIDQFSIDS